MGILAMLVLAFAWHAEGRAQEALRVTVLLAGDPLPSSQARAMLERQVVQAWQRSRPRTGRLVAVEVVTHDGTVDAALHAAEEAARGGAHVLVCCRDAETSRSVARRVAGLGLPVLTLHSASERSTAGWQVAVAMDPAEELRGIIGDAYDRGARTFGIMMPAGSEGDALLARLPGFFGAPGMTLATPARFPTGATVLTPEALWVATRLPDVVIAWGDDRDPWTALWGLRERGWRGPVYLPYAALRVLEARPAPPATTGEVRMLAAPSSTWTFLTPGDPSYAAVVEARAWGAGRLETQRGLADGARLHDALYLLDRAIGRMQAGGGAGLTLEETRARLASALVDLPAVDLATGRYDPDPRVPAAGRAPGGRPVRVVNGRLQPLGDVR